MLLRTRIVLIFGIAGVALMAALLVPLLVVQDLTEQALATQQQEEQDAAWSAALETGATPFQLLLSQMAVDPALQEAASADDAPRTSRLLAAAQARADVYRIDIVARQGRVFASSAGLGAETPLIDTSDLAGRLQRDAWLLGLEARLDGKLMLVVTTAFAGGRALSVAADGGALLRTLGRKADRKLFLVARGGALLLSTSAADWPDLSAALARRDGGRPLARLDGTTQLDRDGRHFDVVSTPLLNTAGLEIGTLVSMRDATAASQRRMLVLLLTGGTALLVFMGLLLALYGFVKTALDPLAEVTGVIRAMAAGDSMVSVEMPDQRDEVGAIAGAVEVFRRDIVALARTKLSGTLRRAQQQALIRGEMAKLGFMLEAGEREGLLADLREIEASSEEGSALAEGFRRMAARVTAQHRKLADLLGERTRDLDTVRQALAERAQLSRLRQELEVARHLQLSSLPQVFPPFPHRRDFEVFAAMEPAKEVGGDFYDFALLDGDRLAVMIGDASGKGVSAAMFIAIGRSILRSAIVRGASPAQALALANSALAVENHTMMFATVFAAILDLRTGWLTYASAGHNPPYLVSHAGGVTTLGGIAGIALGILEDAEYDDEERLMPEGGSIVLFTDGVTEANAPDMSMFEENRLEATLAGLAQAGPDEAVATILAAVRDFAAGAEQADDITVLSARFLGPVRPPASPAPASPTPATGVLLMHEATRQERA